MARSTILSLLFLTSSRGTRLPEDHWREQVVFAELGETVYFRAPSLPQRGATWPTRLSYGSKVFMLGDVGARTGFGLKNFGREDQGQLYSITTGGGVTKFRAELVTRIEVDVGAALYIAPVFSGAISSIAWKYTSNPTAESRDLVNVLNHTIFGSRARVDTITGKLRVSDWRSCDDGFFTVEINGVGFLENYKAVSIVRVKHDGDLHLNPHFVGKIYQFIWYHDNQPAIEYDADEHVKYVFPPCATNIGNCNFDTSTGKLTIKFWQPSSDGVFSMVINGKPYKNGIKVVGGIVFASIGEDLHLNPPPFKGHLASITWLHDKNLAAQFWNQGTVEYYTVCLNNNCILNRTTGTLHIQNWYPTDGKYFTLEINARQMESKYLVAGVNKLDGYEARMEVTYVSEAKAMLTCGGDFDDAEPVMYSWRYRGTSMWEAGTKTMETISGWIGFGRFGFRYDACKIKNPVSERVISLN